MYVAKDDALFFNCLLAFTEILQREMIESGGHSQTVALFLFAGDNVTLAHAIR